MGGLAECAGGRLHAVTTPLPRIVEFGSHPLPDFIADDDDFQTMLDAPVDGSVIRIDTDAGLDVTTYIYNPNAIALDDLGESITALQSRNLKGWGKCNYNFIEAQLTNREDLDWFDDGIESFVDNMVTLAKVAACTGVTGICFDVEDYAQNIWWYAECPNSAEHTLEEYQEQVYNKALQIAEGWQKYANDIKIFFTFAYDGYIGEINGGTPVADASWGLYKNFLDGIHDYWGRSCAANNESALITPYILTTESAYAAASYVSWCRITGEQLGPQCVGYDQPYEWTEWFHKIDQFGLAYWVDNSFSGAYNNASPNTNSMTPAELKQNLVNGLALGANFQWIYNQNYHFFNSASILNSAYITAMEEWREDNGMPNG